MAVLPALLFAPVTKRHRLSLAPRQLAPYLLALVGLGDIRLSRSLIGRLTFCPYMTSRVPNMFGAADTSCFILLALLPHYNVFSGCVSVVSALSLQGFYCTASHWTCQPCCLLSVMGAENLLISGAACPVGTGAASQLVSSEPVPHPSLMCSHTLDHTTKSKHACSNASLLGSPLTCTLMGPLRVVTWLRNVLSAALSPVTGSRQGGFCLPAVV